MTQTPYLFAIDLDGTLLSPDETVTPRTRQAIHSLVRAGHRVCFATGRNYAESVEIIRSAGHETLCVVASGAVVVDAQTGNIVRRAFMHGHLARELVGAIEVMGLTALALQDRELAGVDYLVSHQPPMHAALTTWFERIDQIVQPHEALATHEHAHTMRVSTTVDVGLAANVRKQLIAQFKGRAYVHGILVPGWEVEVIELFDPTVNKWTGISHVAAEWGIPPQRVIAIGDDYNDLPMLTSAGLGIAMGNAREEIKQQVARVIGSNSDDGLAQFIEQWLELWVTESTGDKSRDTVLA